MASSLTLQTLATITRELKEQGETVVVTHGIFDLFHSGHAYFLKESKRLGDYVFVGVESDERAQSYRLTGKPIIPLKERIDALLENRSVDFVFAIDAMPFDTAHYGELYRELNPDIVTFGQRTRAKSGFLKDKEMFPDISFVEIYSKFKGLA